MEVHNILALPIYISERIPTKGVRMCFRGFIKAVLRGFIKAVPRGFIKVILGGNFTNYIINHYLLKVVQDMGLQVGVVYEHICDSCLPRYRGW